MRPGWIAPWRAVAVILLALTAVALAVAPLWAAEAPSEWRATYDVVMRWVNFAILVGVIVYFGRRPVVNLLAGQAAHHETRIRLLEEKRAEALERLNEIKAIEAQSQIRFGSLQERIIALGEQQREALIADARQQGELLMLQAHRRVGMALREARRCLRDEMVDLAVEQALAKLPETVTGRDNQTRVEQFLKAVNR